MKSVFKPMKNSISTEIRHKKKTYTNALTGETTETSEPRELLKNIRGHYTFEFFDKDGKLTEKIEAENAVPLLYSQLGTTRSLIDVGIMHKAGKHIWDKFVYPQFFDAGFVFLTKENDIQKESIRGAIPSGKTVGMACLGEPYAGDLLQVGSVNESMCEIEAGHQMTRLTYAFDFTMEKANGSFDSVWLGHVGSRRYEQDYQEMMFKTLGHFAEVDELSPCFSDISSDLEFKKSTDYPEFLPLNGWQYFGQTFQKNWPLSETPEGYYFYEAMPDSNEVVFQRIEALGGEFDDIEAGGPGVYQGKPAILKRQAIATNMFEFVYFDLYKDTTYQLHNPKVIKLKTESLPNHADLRFISIKSFDDVLYAFFKPYEENWGVDGLVYCVKYSADGSQYLGHTTFKFGEESYLISQDQYKLKSFLDVYRINDVDYMIIAHNNNLEINYATVYAYPITNENKVIDTSKMNAFVEAPAKNSALWRQVHPNDLFFSQSYGIGGAGTLRLWALMVPFSHTKIQTVSKDASQSMRLTYTIEVKHNVSAQYIPLKEDEEIIRQKSEVEEDILKFKQLMEYFTSK